MEESKMTDKEIIAEIQSIRQTVDLLTLDYKDVLRQYALKGVIDSLKFWIMPWALAATLVIGFLGYEGYSLYKAHKDVEKMNQDTEEMNKITSTKLKKMEKFITDAKIKIEKKVIDFENTTEKAKLNIVKLRESSEEEIILSSNNILNLNFSVIILKESANRPSSSFRTTSILALRLPSLIC